MNVRSFVILSVLLVSSFYSQAQNEEGETEEKGFKPENLFTGGSVTVSFFNGQTVLGANPVFGYKLANWVDAGLAFNINYTSARDYQEYDDRIRQTVFGPGVFARVYPISFLFVQAQLEHNFSSLKYIPRPNSSFYSSDKIKSEANSLLLGAGFAQGREPGSTSFFFISVLFDVLQNVNSPYVNVAYDPTIPNSLPRVQMVPIIRAGVNIGLFQGRRGRF